MIRSMRLAIIATVCALPAVAGAQVAIKAGYSFGSVPNSNGVLPGTLSAHDGVAIGVSLSSSSSVGFGVEGMYAQRGFSSTSSGASQKLSYLDVPVYLKVNLALPLVTPYAYAGPQGSYELNCDAGGGTCPSGRPKMTYAGVIGAGAKLGALAGVSLEGRYVYGLTDLNLSTVSNSGNYKTRSFMLLAGIGF